jgi:AAA domain
MTTPAGAIDSLTMVVYGQSKAGKTTLSLTAPYPRLMLDVEAGSKFASITRVYWDPMREEPPVADGSWDTCIVQCTSFEIMLRVYQWLQSGKHQFASLIIDSISELQVKIVEQVAGRTTVQLQQWGDIGRATSGLMRDMRDLTMHPTKPLTAVVLTAMERTNHEGQKQPYLAGQSAITLPYLMDVTGYLVIEEYPNPDPTMPPLRFRRLHIAPSGKFVAGERVGGRLGEVVEQDDLDISRMIARVYGTDLPEPPPPPATEPVHAEPISV